MDVPEQALHQDVHSDFPIDPECLNKAMLRVKLAEKIDAVERKERKQLAHQSWLKTNAEILDMELTDTESNRTAEGDGAKNKTSLVQLKRQLGEVLGDTIVNSRCDK